MKHMLYEFCAENMTQVSQAIQAGAMRIELCDNLAVGGTTPSYGVIKSAVETNVPIMVMIRPRGGNFIYTESEVQMMRDDILVARQLGASGVVFGALNESGWLDETTLKSLIQHAAGLEITFHMAFDAIPTDQQLKAIDWLASNGVTRILTHGGVAASPIEQHIPRLKEFIHHANGRILILPGGGICVENRQAIADALAVRELHGTRIVF